MPKWKSNSKFNLAVYGGGFLWVLCITYFIHYNYLRSEHSLVPISNPENNADYHGNVFAEQEEEQESDKSRPELTHDRTFLMLKQLVSKKAKGSDMYGTIYDKIFKHHDLSSVIANLDFNERCNLYFKNLFLQNHDWKLDPHIDLDLHWDGDEFKGYFQDHETEFLEEFNKRLYLPQDKEEYNKHFEEFVRNKFKAYKQPYLDREMVDSLTTFRIFNQCYLDGQTKSQKFITEQKQFLNRVGKAAAPFQEIQSEKLTDFSTYESFEHRVYPWLSFEYPVYEHWSGATFYKPPNLKKVDFRGKTTKRSFASKPKAGPKSQFLRELKSLSNGRGIILTMPESHVDSTVNLIHLLRALNNKLPIQIVSTDDISLKAKRKLVAAARDDYVTLPKSFEKVAEHFPKDYLTKNGGLPKQELWFVNAHNTINDLYRDKFVSYANKFIAILFNSFAEFMLVDDDTAMMKSPEWFFNLKGYTETGAYFYKDRTSPERRAISDGEMFHRMSPSLVDTIMFDIPVMTQHTLDREFFKGLFHYQEAGMVLVDKIKHFNSLLMVTQISFFGPVHGKMWGEKEMFWLGFAINGDESYEFNENFAAAIGELTDFRDRHRSDGSHHRSRELCSNHPGQIYDGDGHTLLWINSGLRFCHQAEQVDFEDEFKLGSRLKFLHDIEAFKAFYFAPLRITHAVVPPLTDDLQPRGNFQDEPGYGWMMEGSYCRRYLWCAYSSVGGEGHNGRDNYVEGTIVDFTQKEQDLFKYYGDIWVGQE
ncbi:uncharacterized protein SPAPADRAFT_62923 [Spathaspora passalidarum NRRL Y-27907]|uniref:Alpha-1,3-mannosyltransferase n=1 Tax=Spathaspora passalidarum (strain NRRL Y-27907 / 11-Y1) TaxID=619300 RepID=G3AS71_SPAPN|nr:uncharacterized protein SPAPADRAFT_62923 [Spathaspora passalidarum NRRL Y-27907]EGW31030.1 hypothetical protein SPAPADRAFT_62923 [Spathaspora passalidarum NRRL Y-27907]